MRKNSSQAAPTSYKQSHYTPFKLLSASEMTYIVSSGALNSTHSLTFKLLGLMKDSSEGQLQFDRSKIGKRVKFS